MITQLPPKEVSTLLKVSSALAASLDLSTVLQTAIDSTVEVMALDTGAVYLLEEEWLYLGATTPPLAPELDWLRVQAEPLRDHPHIHQAFQRRQPIFIIDFDSASLTAAETAIRDARHLRSVLFIPLLLEDAAIGVMIVGSSRSVREFNDHEIDLCRILSYQVTLAVANARLFKSVQQTNIDLMRAYDATLQGWSLALEMRDQETQGHTMRVTRKTEELARRMGVIEPELTYLRRGALLHDIGKMSVPDAILHKPGVLTAEEWAVMRKHPEMSNQFLVHIDYLKPSLDIPYCHHERWDGSGYPRGLRGEEIPLSARIFAVIDVFDALSSDRPYRQAWTQEEACKYIHEQSGRHFDPSVVKAFMEMVKEQGEEPKC